jgi:DUF4097 and DUF4098 domain-containing protein YvlB
MNENFDTPEPIELHVENGRGSIDITATDTTETSVQITGESADEFEVRDLTDGHGPRRIAIIAPRRNGGFFGKDHKADIRVVMPATSSAVVKSGSADVATHGHLGATLVDSGSGDVRLELIDGPAKLQTGSGDVIVEHLTGEAKVKSGSGDVQVRRADGALVVSTGSGDVRLGKATGSAAVKTGSGDAEVITLSDDLVFTTGSGDLAVEVAKAGRITAKTASGDVRIGVPAGTPVWTDIRTVSGRLHSEIASTGEPAPDQAFLEVSVTTASGDVTLHQS